MKIILASGSPRRKELLSVIDPRLLVLTPNADESFDEGDAPRDIAMNISKAKAKKGLESLYSSSIDKSDYDALIAADTIVCAGEGAPDRKILEKPKDAKDAFDMLKLLSGKRHFVYTGFTVIRLSDEKSVASYEKTAVYFRVLCDEEINAYIKTGEPFDKAGAYGAQGLGGFFIERIEGCFYNVVGLPLAKAGKVFAKMGFKLFI